MTPVWVPLLVAAFGIVGTLGGVLITQRRSDRREDQAWKRERQREREQWAREDHLRTFDQRRDVYVDFYESLRAMARTAYDHGMGLSDGDDELPFDWNTPTFDKLQQLRVFASPEVMAAADRAYSDCWQWGYLTRRGQDDEEFYHRQDVYNDTEYVLFEAIRRDLGVPTADVGGPLPGSGWAPAPAPDDPDETP